MEGKPMSNQDNSPQSPYGGGAQGYRTEVRFGERPDGNPGPGGGFADASGKAPTGDLIKDTTTANFATDVIRESRNQPVLVDFWAPWCGPCKQLTPSLEKAVREAKGAVKLVKMNIDEHPSIPGQLGIQSIPAVIAFRDGQPVDGFMGAVPESQVRAFIEKLGGDPAAAGLEEALAAAAEARQQGDSGMAQQIYSAVLAEAPDNVDALAGLAELLLEAGDIDQASELIASAPADKAEHAAVAAVRAKIAMARQVKELGDPAELERRLAADPKDHQARFDLAMVQNAMGKREEAAENLLAIVRADRSWKDDGARAQLLQFFEAWGMADEATLSARRKLSSLLFS
jgi:putative thioredoxin